MAAEDANLPQPKEDYGKAKPGEEIPHVATKYYPDDGRKDEEKKQTRKAKQIFCAETALETPTDGAILTL